MAARNSTGAPGAAHFNGNSDELIASNRLIGLYPSDTTQNVGDVLEFIAEFHMRKSPNSNSDNVESGMTFVLFWIIDALRKQSKALEGCAKGGPL